MVKLQSSISVTYAAARWDGAPPTKHSRWGRALRYCGEFVVIVLLAATSLPGCACAGVECVDGIWIDGPITVQADRPVQLRLTACRNARCGTGDLVSSDTGVPPHCQFEIPGGGQFAWSLWADTTWWSLEGDFDGSTIDLQDGDVYMLRIVDTSNNDAIVVDMERTVTYSEHDTGQGSPACGSMCQTAVIELPPLPSP